MGIVRLPKRRFPRRATTTRLRSLVRQRMTTVFNHERETPRSSANDIRVVLADDHQLCRQGLKALLELELGIAIVGEASDRLEVQRISLDQNANVVLMDINKAIVAGRCEGGRGG